MRKRECSRGDLLLKTIGLNCLWTAAERSCWSYLAYFSLNLFHLNMSFSYELSKVQKEVY